MKDSKTPAEAGASPSPHPDGGPLGWRRLSSGAAPPPPGGGFDAWRAALGAPPDPSAGSALIAVLFIGPEDISLATLRQVRQRAPLLGVEVSPGATWPQWFALSLGEHAPSTHERVVATLVDWLGRAREVLQSHARIGAWLTLGYGSIQDVEQGRGAFADAEGLAEQIVAGYLGTHASLGRLLQAAGMGFLRDPWEPDLWQIPLLPFRRQTEVSSDTRQSVRESGPPAFSAEARLGWHIGERRTSLPGAGASPPSARSIPRLGSRDHLELSFQAPEGGFVYFLIHQRDQLWPVPGALPARWPGQPRAGQQRARFRQVPGTTHVVMLVTDGPIADLPHRAGLANQSGAADWELLVDSLFSQALRAPSVNAVALRATTPFELIVEDSPTRRALDERFYREEYEQAAALIQVVRADGQADFEDLAFAQVVEARIEQRHWRREAALKKIGDVRADIFAEILTRVAAARSERDDAPSEAAISVESPASYGEFGLARVLADADQELAYILLTMEHLPQALGASERAAENHRAVDDKLSEAQDRFYQAQALRMLGRPAEALVAFDDAIATASQMEPRFHAVTLNGKGQLLQQLLRLDESQAHLERALTLFIEGNFQRRQLPLRGDLGWLMMMRAILARLRGRVSEREAAVRRAIEHFREQIRLATALDAEAACAQPFLNLALAYTEVEDWAEADRSVTQALALFEATDHRQRRRCALAKANILMAGRDGPGAWALLADIDPDNRDLHPRTRWTAALLRGRCLALMGRPGAEAEYRRGVAVLEEVRETLPITERIGYLDEGAELWSHLLALLHADPAVGPGQILEEVEAATARTFLDMIQAQAAAGSPGEPAAQGSAPRAEAPPLSVAAALEILPPSAAFMVFHCLPKGLLLFRIEAGEILPPILIEALGLTELLSLCESVRRETDAYAPGAWDPSPAWRRLSALLLGHPEVAGWLDALAPDTELGLIPHGPLHGVPLHALLLGQRPDRFMVERLCPFYAPSLRSLGALLKRRSPVAGGPPLILANPTEDLSHASEEGRLVASILSGAVVALGADANPRTLFERGPRAPIIHIAAHALKGQGLGAVSRRGRMGSAATLRLAVADRAWHYQQQLLDELGEPSGDLGAADLLRLNLCAELVVLAACESGAGEVSTTGEGADLLSWALLQGPGGACRAVVSAGWHVSDPSTKKLMTQFYEALAAGTSRAMALAKAARGAIELEDAEPLTEGAGGAPAPGGGALVAHATPTSSRRRLSHPREWAAFSILGDWRAIGVR